MEALGPVRREAREIFDEALAASDARAAVLRAVEFEGERLRVCGEQFDLRGGSPLKVYAVALGKAAAAMASGLEEHLGSYIEAGVVAAPPSGVRLPPRWRVFEGGHPLPDAGSLEAARAALGLLRRADEPKSLVVFLVSGGGSAMLEWPRDERVTLGDLREANRVLVTCGAGIDEVNAVRRAFSAVKGGGLAAAAPRARQVTLIVSDVSRGEGSEADVASGPTLPPRAAHDARGVVARHGLAPRLPPSILRAVEEYAPPASVKRGAHAVLLDNLSAVEAAADAARSRGYAAEVAADICEQEISAGTSLMVGRLARLQSREGGRVCLVSGGEFACPVRGRGVGGRNSETALRCAFEFDRLTGDVPRRMVALCAGTDGVDGNSPAAGALSDTSTLRRAREAGLNAETFLEDSDAHSFFHALGDALVTGPTGTNVRDLRILLAV